MPRYVAQGSAHSGSYAEGVRSAGVAAFQGAGKCLDVTDANDFFLMMHILDYGRRNRSLGQAQCAQQDYKSYPYSLTHNPRKDNKKS